MRKDKLKVGQFDHYKRWTSNEGYTFLAKDLADAELYQKKMNLAGKLSEVIVETNN
jgi:hypothetical protein